MLYSLGILKANLICGDVSDELRLRIPVLSQTATQSCDKVIGRNKPHTNESVHASFQPQQAVASPARLRHPPEVP
ncbi:hypothetical protein [Chlorogloea sp. CCALA 695]|uniref:hypothetical protein n=1 Tax=Chlorogloea sp. CCALA 695 TaxID=2107693 RepID=UPI001304B8B8|nr:hypothetical protein [Chlorogloea sp. CCALA 695]